MRTFTAYVEFDSETNRYVGIVSGLPGAHTQASSLDRLRENLQEVVELCLEELGVPVTGWISEIFGWTLIMLQPGDKAPDIKLESDTGEVFQLSKLKGKKVVLYFFPRADTPGWTQEAHEFRDAIKKFEKKGAVVLGISPDTPRGQARFKEKHGLPFTLLCDVDKQTAKAYGVLKEKNMYGNKVLGIERTTFLIGGNGTIEKIFTKVKPQGHAEEVLSAL